MKGHSCIFWLQARLVDEGALAAVAIVSGNILVCHAWTEALWLAPNS